MRTNTKISTSYLNSIWTSQRRCNAGEMLDLLRTLTAANGLRPDSHGFFQSINFGALDLNAPLAARAALEVVDRERLTANDELATIRTGEPVVQARYGNSELLCCVLCRV
jgi:hypothetical protein